MAQLDLYTGREHNTILVEVDGGKKEILLSKDFTVEDIERLYELEIKIGAEKSEYTTEQRWDFMIGQAQIMLHRKHPEITVEIVKKYFTHKQVMEILKFAALHSSLEALTEKMRADEKKTQKKSLPVKN